MKIFFPMIDVVMELTAGTVNTLVVENQNLFRQIVDDLYSQSQGNDGEIVLSEDNTPVSIAKNLDLITQFVPFEINRKTLLTKIQTELENRAIAAEFYESTQLLLAKVEKYLYDLSFNSTAGVEFPKLAAGTLLKAAGLRIREDYDTPEEKIADYLNLATEYENKKIFFFVNMRSFFNDTAMEKILQDACRREYRIMLLDNLDNAVLSREKRLTIDNDLCVI